MSTLLAVNCRRQANSYPITAIALASKAKDIREINALEAPTQPGPPYPPLYPIDTATMPRCGEKGPMESIDQCHPVGHAEAEEEAKYVPPVYPMPLSSGFHGYHISMPYYMYTIYLLV
jgi:hypothetical protein